MMNSAVNPQNSAPKKSETITSTIGDAVLSAVATGETTETDEKRINTWSTALPEVFEDSNNKINVSMDSLTAPSIEATSKTLKETFYLTISHAAPEPEPVAPKGSASVILKSDKFGKATLVGKTKDIPVGEKVELIIIDSEGNTVKTFATVSKNAYSVMADIKGLVDGPLKVLAVTTDKNGDQISGTGSFQKNIVKGGLTIDHTDTSDPSATVISGTSQDLAPGERILIEIKGPGNVTVKATATVGSDGRYATTADLSKMVDGKMVIKATAADRNAYKVNTCSSAELDAHESDLSVASKYVGKTKVEFSGLATDIPVRSLIYLTVTNNAGREMNFTARVNPDGTYKITKELQSFADGPLKVEAVATDRNGNVLTADNDTVEPRLSISFDNLNRETVSQTIFRGETTGIKPGETVIVTATDEAGNSVKVPVPVRADGTFIQTIDLTKLVDGDITLSAHAKDKRGNIVKSATEAELDAVEGRITAGFANLQEKTVNQVVMSGTSTDIAPGDKVVLTVTDQEGNAVSVTTTIRADGTFIETADLRGLVDGKLILTAVSTDRNGNSLTTESMGKLNAVDGGITVDMGALEDVKKVNFFGTTSDVRPGSDITLVVTDSAGKDIKILAKVDADGTYKAIADLSSLKEGKLTVEAATTDRNGEKVEAADSAALESVSDPAMADRSEDIDAIAGRVTTIDLSNVEGIQSVRILSQGEHGHVSVNPDHSIAVVLTEESKNLDTMQFSYEITYQDGRIEKVIADVIPEAGPQDAGWGLGNFYMLEQDKSGNIVVEHGDNHRKVFVTGGEHGLTKEDIAEREGLPVSKINGSWLVNHPEYGGSPEMALSEKAGSDLWTSLTANKATSNWLLLERGEEYEGLGRLISRGGSGESELNPLYIGTYGEGHNPVISEQIQAYQANSNHVVIEGLNAPGLMALQGSNMLLNKMNFSVSGLNVQNVTNFTLINSQVVDIHKDNPVGTGETWAPHLNRESGIYISNTKGIYLAGNLVDRNGWEEGYDVNLSVEYPQPPNMYSHNIYLQFDNLDVMLVDNIISRGASFGVQVRSGGVVEGNLLLDNNAHYSLLGGNYKGAGLIGNYSLSLDNVITSAGHKRVKAAEGALSMGIDEAGRMSAFIGNIIAHLADPNNAKEIAEKGVVHNAYKISPTTVFEDTILYNWKSKDKNLDRNVEGLDRDVLNQTTIQKFAEQLLGKDKATIADLMTYLKAQDPDGAFTGSLTGSVGADTIINFFRNGFGLNIEDRNRNETVRFSPDDRGDGIRWDNKLNWSSGDKPMEGDNIDLGGNRVFFGTQTVTVDDFVFGDFGELKATSGKLVIDGVILVEETGALVEIDEAGQVWIDGYRDSDMLEINVAGGRFTNTGKIVGSVDMHVSDNAQAMLATPGGSFDLMDGSSLTIEGSRVRVGFDGHNGDTGVLRMHDGSMLAFKADAAGLSTLGEFRSGAFGKGTEIASAVCLDGNLEIDVSAWVTGVSSATRTLIRADQLVGSFDEIEVIGLAPNRNATLVIDHDADELRFILGTEKGNGKIETIIIGENRAENWSSDPDAIDLWRALNQTPLAPLDDPLSY